MQQCPASVEISQSSCQHMSTPVICMKFIKFISPHTCKQYSYKNNREKEQIVLSCSFQTQGESFCNVSLKIHS